MIIIVINPRLFHVCTISKIYIWYNEEIYLYLIHETKLNIVTGRKWRSPIWNCRCTCVEQVVGNRALSSLLKHRRYCGNVPRQKRLFSVYLYTPLEGTLHVDEPSSHARLSSRISLCGFATQFHAVENWQIENRKIAHTAWTLLGIAHWITMIKLTNVRKFIATCQSFLRTTVQGPF